MHLLKYHLDFLNDNKLYDFLCNFIHNDKYIVNAYSPSTSKEYKKIFKKFKNLLINFENFISILKCKNT